MSRPVHMGGLSCAIALMLVWAIISFALERNALRLGHPDVAFGWYISGALSWVGIGLGIAELHIKKQ